jgi:hypothetical protein
MAAAKKSPPVKPAADVESFMQALDHPMKAGLQALRDIILAADPSIAEGIKWNAPSFRTTEYFATTNLRARDCAQLILHFGARVNTISSTGVTIDDPEKLLTWLGKDRATIRFSDMNSVHRQRDAFTAILRRWIVHVK